MCLLLKPGKHFNHLNIITNPNVSPHVNLRGFTRSVASHSVQD